jgi:uncharacterized membrane protein YphA (DoxX/SURF4 family)
MHAVLRLLISQLAAFLALLLLASAVHKSVRWAHIGKVVHEFGSVPRSAAPWAAVAAMLGELLAAVLLLLPAQRLSGALLAALIWCVYLALMLRAIAQGRRNVDCGCSFGASPHPLGGFEVARNAVLVAFALLVAASAAGGAVPLPASQLLGACALLALYGALDQVMAVRPLRPGDVL